MKSEQDKMLEALNAGTPDTLEGVGNIARERAIAILENIDPSALKITIGEYIGDIDEEAEKSSSQISEASGARLVELLSLLETIPEADI